MQRTKLDTTFYRLIGRIGHAQRIVFQHTHDGVDVRVYFSNAVKMRLHHFTTTHRSIGNVCGQFYRAFFP